MVELSNPSLNELFFSQEEYFKLKIPDYQRIYCWEEKHVLRLLNDLKEHAHHPYHLGSIILHQPNLEENTFEIVDGQQRLITLALILSELGKTDIQLLTEKFQSKKANEYVAYNKHLIKQFNTKEKDSLNAENILQNMKFSVLTLSNTSLDLAYTFFTNQNARGKALSDFDLLKSHHLRFILHENQAEFLAAHWDNLVQQSNNDDHSGDLWKTMGLNLFRLRKWMRKRNWNEYEERMVKIEFEAARIISKIPPFGEQFHFYETVQGGSHFFAYVDHFVDRYREFKTIPLIHNLQDKLQGEKFSWYQEVIENFLFAYFLKFGSNFLNEAALLIIRYISQNRFDTYRAYHQSILKYAAESEIVMMIDQATSPTFFLAELEQKVEKLPLIDKSELTGTRERYYGRLLNITNELPIDDHFAKPHLTYKSNESN